nr:hypothetical protein [Alphaproteobacteria bacterium]
QQQLRRSASEGGRTIIESLDDVAADATAESAAANTASNEQFEDQELGSAAVDELITTRRQKTRRRALRLKRRWRRHRNLARLPRRPRPKTSWNSGFGPKTPRYIRPRGRVRRR